MRWLITLIVALVAGFGGAALWDYSGLGGYATREYLLANPEVLPEAVDELNRRETVARLEPVRSELETPFPGAVLGNPDGKVVMVEFSDYACGYCRRSLKEVDALIAANPDLKVVIREFPILSENSADAARMALAAAEQGRFAAFHNAMYAREQVNGDTILAAANEAGLDVEKAKAAIASGRYEGQLQNNVFLGQNLAVRGTPFFVVGDRTFDGFVPQADLAEAVAEARDS